MEDSDAQAHEAHEAITPSWERPSIFASFHFRHPPPISFLFLPRFDHRGLSSSVSASDLKAP